MQRGASSLATTFALVALSLLVAACPGEKAEPIVSIAVTPSTTTLPAGDSITFEATVGGASDTSVVWNVEEANGGSITSSGVYTAPASEGTFHVVATSRADPSKTAKATIKVTPAQQTETVAVAISPNSLVLLDQGDTQIFSATVTGAANTGVTWTVAGGEAAGTVTAAGVYTAPFKAGTYEVRATSAADPTKFATASVTVKAVEIAITPASLTLTQGEVFTFSATVTGSVNTAVSWQVVGGAAGGTITQDGLYTAPLSNGTFQVRATSESDATKSITAAVTVEAPMSNVAVAVSPKNVPLHFGQTQQFNSAVSGTTNTQVTWSIDQGSAGGTVSSTGLYTAPAVAGTYTVRATSLEDVGRSDFATVTVTAPPPVTVTLSPTNPTVFTNATQQFNATVTNATDTAVTWSVDQTNGGAITQSGLYTAPAAAGTFTVRATSVEDPSKSATATVTVNEPPPVIVAVTPKTPNVVVNNTQQFAVTVSNASNPGVTWSVDQGSSGGIITADGLYTAPATPGTYTVRAISVEDATRFDTATVNVTTAPVVNVEISPAAPTLIAGASQVFDAVVSNASDVSVLWSIRDSAGAVITNGGSFTSTGATQATYVAPSTPGTYFVRATANADSSKFASATVTVNPAPPVTVSVTPSTQTLYSSQSVELTGTVIGASNTAVNFAVVDAAGNPHAAGGSITAHPTDGSKATYTAPGAAGTYYVRASSVESPSSYATATMTVVDGSFTVSGTVSYSGARTGRIYILVQDSEDNYLATASVAGPGPYSVRGLSYEETVKVSAFMDHVGSGGGAANSPTTPIVTATRTTFGGNITQDLTLTDPAPVTVASPGVDFIVPGTGSAMVVWTDNASAERYTVYWNQTGSPGPSNSLGSKVVPKTSTAFIGGLTSGTWHFALAAHNGTTVLAPGASQSVTIGGGTGTNQITGTVTTSGGTPVGDLYVVAYSAAPYASDRMIRIANPGPSQSYTLGGLNDDSYEQIFVVLDANSDGVLDHRDLYQGITSTFSLAGGQTHTADFRFDLGAYASSFQEQSQGVTDRYLYSGIQSLNKLAVNVVLSGPGLSQPIDVPRNFQTYGSYDVGLYRLLDQLPTAGSNYTLAVSYSDGTSANFTVAAPQFFGFPTNLTPTGTITNPTPAFSYSAPNPAPLLAYSYTHYLAWVGQDGQLQIFWNPVVASSTTSFAYNFDGSSADATLIPDTYYWIIDVADANGNLARLWHNFIVQ